MFVLMSLAPKRFVPLAHRLGHKVNLLSHKKMDHFIDLFSNYLQSGVLWKSQDSWHVLCTLLCELTFKFVYKGGKMKQAMPIFILNLVVITAFSLSHISRAHAEGEFPMGCTWNGGSFGTGTMNSDGTFRPAKIGESIVVYFGLETNSNEICAFEGGQIAITDPAGNFVEVAGFDTTPAIPIIHTDSNGIHHPKNFRVSSPPLEIRCEDVQMQAQAGCDDCAKTPVVRGLYGYGTNFQGVPLQSGKTYDYYPPSNYAMGAWGGWSYTIDADDYGRVCFLVVEPPETSIEEKPVREFTKTRFNRGSKRR
jgi:hypothetical protein